LNEKMPWGEGGGTIPVTYGEKAFHKLIPTLHWQRNTDVLGEKKAR